MNDNDHDLQRFREKFSVSLAAECHLRGGAPSAQRCAEDERGDVQLRSGSSLRGTETSAVRDRENSSLRDLDFQLFIADHSCKVLLEYLGLVPHCMSLFHVECRADSET